MTQTAQQWRDAQGPIQDAQTAALARLEATVARMEGKLDDHGVRLAALLDGQTSIEQGQTALLIGQDEIKGGIQDVLDQLGEQQPATKTLWGANTGGYVVTLHETPADAYARISAAYGRLNVARWWAPSFVPWTALPSYIGASTAVSPDYGSDVAGVLAGNYDAAWTTICQTADRPTYATFAHEPEDDVFTAHAFTVGQWQSAQLRLAAIKAQVGNPLMKFGTMLMGGSYHPVRYVNMAQGNIPASQWHDFDLTNLDFVGGDCYQWGVDDAHADHAETVIGPLRDFAINKAKQVVIGELGAIRRSDVSDSIRARWITETAADVAAHPGLYAAILYYESDRGKNPPWALLPPPGQDPNDPQFSPLAVAAMRALCTA